MSRDNWWSCPKPVVVLSREGGSEYPRTPKRVFSADPGTSTDLRQDCQAPGWGQSRQLQICRDKELVLGPEGKIPRKVLEKCPPPHPNTDLLSSPNHSQPHPFHPRPKCAHYTTSNGPDRDQMGQTQMDCAQMGPARVGLVSSLPNTSSLGPSAHPCKQSLSHLGLGSVPLGHIRPPGYPHTGAALGQDELKGEDADKLIMNEFGKTKTRRRQISQKTKTG